MKKTSTQLSRASSKKELLHIQRTFAEIIRTPLNAQDKMKPDNRTEKMLLPNSKLSAHERHELYAQQYWWRIEHSFDEDFPALKAVLGDSQFRMIRDDYLYRYPSVSFTLRDLGSRFPAFIKKNRTLSASKRALCYECACFEWGRIDAFDAAQREPLSPRMVMKPGFEKKRLYLQPHISLFHFTYPIHQLIKEIRTNRNQMSSNVGVYESETTKGKKPFSLKPKDTYLVVHRHEFKVLMKPISKQEWKALTLFQKGCSLKGLDAHRSLFRGIAEKDMYKWFQEWVSLGWLI